MIFMVLGGMPARYMAIAAPLRRECKPMSDGKNPKDSKSMVAAADLILESRKLLESCCVRLLGS